jgi:hypothetical protein
MKKGTGWDDSPGMSMPFQLKRLDMAVGSSHPAVARLVLGTAELIQMTAPWRPPTGGAALER